MASGYITIDTTKAESILRGAALRVRKTNFRAIARPAATILRDDMRSSAGRVPKYKKGKYHWFARPGYKIKIRAGNLRKAHTLFAFRKSMLMWVGPKYRKSLNGQTIGETLSTADGFYAAMYIAKTGDDFMKSSLAKNKPQVESRLRQDAEKFVRDIADRANATR